MQLDFGFKRRHLILVRIVLIVLSVSAKDTTKDAKGDKNQDHSSRNHEHQDAWFKTVAFCASSLMWHAFIQANHLIWLKAPAEASDRKSEQFLAGVQTTFGPFILKAWRRSEVWRSIICINNRADKYFLKLNRKWKNYLRATIV